MTTSYNPDNMLAQASKSERIRQLNDAFRTQPFLGAAFDENQLVITAGVAVRGFDFVDRAVAAVRTFSNFTDANNPNGEHDFGSFDLDAVKLFWKIDYYDRQFRQGSSDPADPAATRRVLTILLAEEY